MHQRYACSTLFVSVCALAAATAVHADLCVPPQGFVDTAPPSVTPLEHLISHTEEVTIERPIAFLRELAARTPLAQGIDRTGPLPGVSGTHRLTPNLGYPRPGARRLVCLTDGFTLVEQVVLQEENADSDRFRYVVWSYTSPKYPGVAYAVGEITRTAVGPTRTHVRWTYSFQLDREAFPGTLGDDGDRVFRESFLERQFAVKMRNSLANGKKRAEATPLN